MKTYTLSANNVEVPLWEEGFARVMGLDEVGRGCLAGPVVAAGVIFNPNNIPEGIYDSKKLSARKRATLAEEIKIAAAFWSVQHCEPEEIDKLNILWASMRAMEKCVQAEGADPDYLLVDGNRYLPTLTPHQCLVKGDSRCVSIAAASILAKEHRDAYMKRLDEVYPEFNWVKNVGYPTRDHYEALIKHGYTPQHRQSFKLRTKKVYLFT
ncbi:MAG: ribonuclease HII [Bacteroidetes bacterium]|nr:ribonuclease HII [Bacteroidota bacterium]MCH8523689.1 ribonuclease HII [Balneolales bacterium]